MRSKNFFFLAVVLIMVSLLIYLISSNGGQAYTWKENYKEQSKGPYGLTVVFKLLKAQAKTESFTLLKKRIQKVLPTEPNEKSNYVFVGGGQFLDSADVQTLLKFVYNGNDAFIATQVLPFRLMSKLYPKTCKEDRWENLNYYQDRGVEANFLHPDLRQKKPFAFTYRTTSPDSIYDWHFFDRGYFCDDPDGFVALGQINGSKTNFVRIRYGLGHFYLHTNPLFFTNLFMINQSGKAYAEAALGHLSTGPVYWDCTSKVDRAVAENMNDDGQGRPRRDFNRPSPLSYVLSQPPLAWAWYTLLATTLVYFLFRIKRRQRIIPVLPSNKNNSLAFIRTIGRLYFLQNNHRQLVLQKMKLFLQFVRDRYKIQTRELQEEFVYQLSVKSEIKAEKIQKILDSYRAIDFSPEIQERILADFHQQIESFYKNCK
jgi:hypothetical protein